MDLKWITLFGVEWSNQYQSFQGDSDERAEPTLESELAKEINFRFAF